MTPCASQSTWKWHLFFFLSNKNRMLLWMLHNVQAFFWLGTGRQQNPVWLFPLTTRTNMLFQKMLSCLSKLLLNRHSLIFVVHRLRLAAVVAVIKELHKCSTSLWEPSSCFHTHEPWCSMTVLNKSHTGVSLVRAEVLGPSDTSNKVYQGMTMLNTIM